MFYLIFSVALELAGDVYTDMIFVARLLTEKAWELVCIINFVDLKKAYGSVPCPALWRVLEKSGVALTLVSIIRSFHEGSRHMSAKVIVGQGFTGSIGVCNGMCQGCTMTSVLFSSYFCSSGR